MANIGDVLVMSGIALAMYFTRNAHIDPKGQSPYLNRSREREVTAVIGGWIEALFSCRRSSADSVVLGRKGVVKKRLRSSDSLLVFGPTRSGKTLGLCLPILTEFSGPCVVTSVKRDLYSQSSRERAEIGECYIFDLTSRDSSSWNIFSLVNDLSSAKDVGEALCRTAHNAKGELAFWGRLASKALAPLLIAAKELDQPFAEVVRWVESQDFEPAFEALTEGSHYQARSSLDALTRLDPRTMSSVVATLLSLLEPYSDPFVSSLISTDGIDIENVLDSSKSNTLYVCSPLFQSERLFGVYEMFLRRVFEVAYRRGDSNSRILFLLDELANVAPISDLDKVASTCGGYGMILLSVFQDLSQLEAIYGAKARTVVNNHRSKLCFSGITDVSTLDYVARFNSHQSTRTDTRSPLLDLRRGTALLLESGGKVGTIKLKQVSPGLNIR